LSLPGGRVLRNAQGSLRTSACLLDLRARL
jgi:hypothetical protein